MLIGMIAVLVVAAIVGGLALADVVLHWMLALAAGIFLGGVIWGLATKYIPRLFGEGKRVGQSERVVTKPPGPGQVVSEHEHPRHQEP